MSTILAQGVEMCTIVYITAVKGYLRLLVCMMVHISLFRAFYNFTHKNAINPWYQTS